MTGILVADVMTRDPITVKPDISLLDSAKIMVKKRVGTLLLAEKKKLVGVISRKDILWALVKKSKNDLTKIKAIEISPKKIATIKPLATTKEAIQKMKNLKFEWLPVLHEKELVGMVTLKDILRFEPEAYPELDELAQIKEEEAKLKRLERAKSIREGICEECGNFDFLTRVHGMLICSDCRNKI